MTSPYRIKTVNFASATPVSGTNSAAVYSTEVINGEILKVEWNTNTTGSLLIGVSGTNEELFRINAPSGAAAVINVAYPYVVGVTNINAAGTGSPTNYFSRIVNEPIFWTGTGMDGGSIVHLAVKYR